MKEVAKSKAQQRFMGIVRSIQKGENPSKFNSDAQHAAKSMKKKDVKDFASTKHKGLPDKKEQEERLRTSIKKFIREMNVTGNVQGYATPKAFDKKQQKKNTEKANRSVGYTTVKDSVNEVSLQETPLFQKIMKAVRHKATPLTVIVSKKGKLIKQQDVKTHHQIPAIFVDLRKTYKDAKISIEDGNGKIVYVDSINENDMKRPITENRWLDLKKDDSPAKAKIGRGISSVNKQLAEVEKFLKWYSRLKSENGIDNSQFWKRTNNNIYKIKERLLKISQNIRKISE